MDRKRVSKPDELMLTDGRKRMAGFKMTNLTKRSMVGSCGEL